MDNDRIFKARCFKCGDIADFLCEEERSDVMFLSDKVDKSRSTNMAFLCTRCKIRRESFENKGINTEDKKKSDGLKKQTVYMYNGKDILEMSHSELLLVIIELGNKVDRLTRGIYAMEG